MTIIETLTDQLQHDINDVLSHERPITRAIELGRKWDVRWHMAMLLDRPDIMTACHRAELMLDAAAAYKLCTKLEALMTRQSDYTARHGLKQMSIWLTPDERALLDSVAGTDSKKQTIIKALRMLNATGWTADQTEAAHRAVDEATSSR
jgi:hypothetical protein